MTSIILNMWTGSVFVCMIVLLVTERSEGSSCSFTGSCLYNINVHHTDCGATLKRALQTGSHRLCPCSDVTALQNDHKNLSSWIGNINSTFLQISADLRGIKAELTEKSTELAATINSNTKNNITYNKYVKDITATENAITNERQIWFKERDRLHNEIHKIIRESQICQQAATTSTSSHQGKISLSLMMIYNKLNHANIKTCLICFILRSICRCFARSLL